LPGTNSINKTCRILLPWIVLYYLKYNLKNRLMQNFLLYLTTTAADVNPCGK
jgi:hypothetical protein